MLEVLRHGADLEAIHALFDEHAFDYSGLGMDDINTLRRILKESRVIAVVGLSADWYRPSYFAAKYMQEHGYRIIPVNPKYESILGEKCYRLLRDIPERVDIVDVFRKTQDVMPIAEDAIAIGAKVLWQQLGVRNEEAAAKARAAGLEAVLDRCVKIEHGRLFGVELGRGQYEGHIRQTPPLAGLLAPGRISFPHGEAGEDLEGGSGAWS